MRIQPLKLNAKKSFNSPKITHFDILGVTSEKNMWFISAFFQDGRHKHILPCQSSVIVTIR